MMGHCDHCSWHTTMLEVSYKGLNFKLCSLCSETDLGPLYMHEVSNKGDFQQYHSPNILLAQSINWLKEQLEKK